MEALQNEECHSDASESMRIACQQVRTLADASQKVFDFRTSTKAIHDGYVEPVQTRPAIPTWEGTCTAFAKHGEARGS